MLEFALRFPLSYVLSLYRTKLLSTLSRETPISARSSCSARALLRQRSKPQVWFYNLQIREHLLRFFGLDTWMNNHIVTWHPVDRGGDPSLVTRLQAIHNP